MTILNTSVSGMLADSNWLSSISQNVANANTTGYKNAETEFSTLVDQVSTAAAGGGVMTTTRNLNSLQGNVVSSSTATNLAVQGSGFFVVSDSSGATYLTRNGSFVPDASGNLVNSAGYYLMGTDIQSGSSPPCKRSEHSAKSQCQFGRRDRHADHERIDRRQFTFERDADRRRRPALGELCKLDLH
jgi:flagellar hook protein FlgE